MTSRKDAVFLEEIVSFLHSCDQPAFPLSLGLDDVNPEALLIDTAALLPPSLASNPLNSDTKQVTNSKAKPTPREVLRSKDAVRRRVYREQQKQEREQLHRQVAELSAELASIQAANEDPTTWRPTEQKLSNCLWKAIASRQREGRRAAEDQQRRLHAAIGARATLIADLNGLLRQRIRDTNVLDYDSQDGEEDIDGSSYRHKRMRLEAPDAALYETYLHKLDVIYAQTDEVFASCGVDSISGSSHRSKHIRKMTGGTEYFEYVDKQLLPFDFRKTCRSIWQVANLQHRQQDRQLYRGVTDSENTSAVKFRVTSHQNGPAVSLLQRVVVRRYEEPDRVVLVWSVLTEGEGCFKGLHCEETGWCRVRPASSSSEAGTIMEECVRHVPMHFSNAIAKEPIVGQFTEMVLSTGEENNQEVLHAMDKLLLDEV
ncbi:hypothetical protein BBJ28_00003399 [Nothophytophthora sp. Chile5]|nr:hypothetical protein BBJ28_00003399 [Nothophytophthora sp. Chile5]